MNEKGRYEVYRVARPTEMLGLPSHLKWAVSKDGAFEEAFRTKKEANDYVAEQCDG